MIDFSVVTLITCESPMADTGSVSHAEAAEHKPRFATMLRCMRVQVPVFHERSFQGLLNLSQPCRCGDESVSSATHGGLCGVQST